MKNSLYKAHLIFELLRSTGEREFPAQLSSTFLWVAANEGCRQEDVAKALNIARSSVSRNLSWLGNQHRFGKPGLHLVERRRDENIHDDPRSLRCYLTPKGNQIASMIEKILHEPAGKVARV